MHCPVRVVIAVSEPGLSEPCPAPSSDPSTSTCQPLNRPASRSLASFQPAHQDGRIAFPRRRDLPMPKHGGHVSEVDAALPELQSHAVPRLIGPYVLRPARRVQRLGANL
jgi:hypothetical protein